MKTILVIPVVFALSLLVSCQKQKTDAERQAEVDREVQRRVDAEHQAQEKEQLAQREAALRAREQELGQQENATPPPREADTRPLDTEEQPPPVTGSYNTFYTNLERYGDWMETSDYGYVFQPRESQQSRSWRPYVSGHWVYTEAGWTWASDEPFGWATYHYGRWTRLRNVGWVWVPGDEWAPAWVSWRKSNDFVGWAPLPPEARFDRRAGIRNWADSYYDIGPDQYCFVATTQFGTPRVEQAVIPAQRNITIINETTNVTNITYTNNFILNQGPSYAELRERSQQPIQRLRLNRRISTNIALENPRTSINSEVLEIPAPAIARAQAVERPRKVKQTISNTVVDRGWDEIHDQQAVVKIREKMKSEATPPPDAPPKTFMKAGQGAGPSTVPATATPQPAVSSAPTQANAESPASTPRGFAGAETARPTMSPSPTAPRQMAPSPTVNPSRSPSIAPTSSPASPARPNVGVRSTEKPSSSVIPPHPSPSIDVSSTQGNQANEERPRVGGRLKSQAQKFQPRRVVPMDSAGAQTASSASPSPALTPNPTEATSPGRFGEMRQKQERLRKRGAGQNQPTDQTPSPAPNEHNSPTSQPSTPTTSTSGSAGSPQQSSDKKGRRKQRSEVTEPQPSGTPTPSPR